MIVISSQEINNFRSQLTAYKEAITALDTIQDCDGYLEDAAMILAIDAGEEPDRSEGFLENLARRCRSVICEESFKDDLLAGLVAGAVEALLNSALIPPGLATPVVIYVVKKGVDNFCKNQK